MSNEYDYSGLYNNGQGGSTPDPNQGQNNDQPRNEANQDFCNPARSAQPARAGRLPQRGQQRHEHRQHRPHRLLGRQQHQ